MYRLQGHTVKMEVELGVGTAELQMATVLKGATPG